MRLPRVGIASTTLGIDDPGGLTRDVTRSGGTDRTTAGIEVAVGTAVAVGAAGIGALLPAGGWAFVPVAVALAGFAAWARRPSALVAVGVLAYLIIDGFLVNQYGEISWHGMTDMYRLAGVIG